jgi:ATP-dependent HslUV protease ATP-binding subunit HslU
VKKLESLKTPKDVFDLLQQFVVGQEEAKKAISIAFFNRQRRMLIKDEKIRDSIVPKNIIISGNTGVGKTEIIRKLAELTDSPFVKTEMTKFTEVGYSGKDVDTIIKDLVESTMRKRMHSKRDEIIKSAKNKIAQQILDAAIATENSELKNANIKDIVSGKYDECFIEISVDSKYSKKLSQSSSSIFDSSSFSPQIGIIPIGEILSQTMKMADEADLDSDSIFKKKPNQKILNVTVKEAKERFGYIEFDQQFDENAFINDVLRDVEQNGIVFLDEIDKLITHKDATGRGEVSREGVQRDLLSIVEGAIVNTRYGQVDTRYILFVGAGAFHGKKVGDLMPELRGRFPIRVELSSLTKENMQDILTKVKHNLIEQQVVLMKSSNIEIAFTQDAISEIASISYQMNMEHENIGARRLHAVIETIVEDVSFYGNVEKKVSKKTKQKQYETNEQNVILIDKEYVIEKMQKELSKKINTNKFII